MATQATSAGVAALLPARPYKSFKEFYPFYLSQHRRTGTRVLHLVGTAAFLTNTVLAVTLARRWRQLALGPVIAYGLAWIGHFFVENNRPATFKYPLWSLLGDFKMFFSILTGKEPLVVADGGAK